MNETTFAAHVAAQQQAQQHAEEIQKTRVGGLGGSDANILLKVGESGLGALTLTDTKRLCVMVGSIPPETWSGNAYTNAGHLFEEFAERTLPFGEFGYEREKLLTSPLALNFKIFAHADFVYGKGGEKVIECKFVQADTDKVLERYMPQLQWYYMLGAKEVTLFHGQGKAEPFEVEDTAIAAVERDEAMISKMLSGIAILDDALATGWRPAMPDKIALCDTPQIIQEAFAEMAAVKDEEKALKERKNAASETIREFVEAWGYTGIVSEDKHQVVYTKASVSKSFDAEAFLRDNPQYYEVEKYWKVTNRKASVSLK